MATAQENGRTTSDEVKGENIHTASQYTIGWICALPIELAAAVKMLDEEHPRLPQDPKDDNSYRFGRIGNHNIVIGCLPHGRLGLVSSASVALQMKNSFDNLRIGLMVGIGGAVPSQETDIQLGDIVVSSPTGQHGGVVQYDLGKTRLNGEIQRTGSLNSPPNALLHVLTEMVAAQEMGELQINNYLSRLAQKLPAYAFPSKLTDCLYQPHHTHKSGKSCSECGGSENQVLREDRDDGTPVVHYGTIASGNQVMKDAFTRDKLSHELGGVLCYEMEAAGLMNNFPCLVIRGISDYSDIHKNDGWQRYAAAVAAAYAKDLLGHLATAKVDQTETLNKLMGDLSQGMARNQILIEEVGSRLDKVDEGGLLKWLSPSSNFSRIQNAARSNFMLGTGEGVLGDSNFGNWRDNGSGLLWLHGIAGCGKTTLTSKIIDHLSDRPSSGEFAHLAYWYFQFSNPDTQHIPSMLRSIIRQLVRRPLPHNVQDMWKKHGPPGSEPSMTELISALTDLVIHSSPDLYLVFDAMDECPLQVRSEFLAILGELLRASTRRLRILVTSRREPDIRKALVSLATYTLDANALLEKDVEFFVTSSLNHDSIQRWGSRLGDLAAKRLLSLEERRFRWADLQIKRLQDCSTEDDFRISLNSLPESLEAIYREALESVSSKDRERVLHILAWLTASFRELRSSEVAAVLAFPFTDDVLKLCKSILITVIDDDAGDTIKLAHYSVKEFLVLQNEQQEGTQWYKLTASLAHRYITTKLLDCLFDDPESPYSLVLYDYAQWYWPSHVKQCGQSDTIVRSRVATLFSEEARKKLLRLLVCSRAQKLWSREHEKRPHFELVEPDPLSLKQVVVSSWTKQGPLWNCQGFERSVKTTIGDVSIWLGNRCDKIVDALDLIFIMESMRHEIPATLHALLQIGLRIGLQNAERPARKTSKSWLGSSDLHTLKGKARTLALFSNDMVNLEGQQMLEVLTRTAVDFPESSRQTPSMSSRLVSAVITLFDRWQPQLHYTDLILNLLVQNRAKTHDVLDGLLHHIKLATVDEERMALVALTACAYEVTRFFLSTVTSEPQIIEHAAPEVFRQLLFWASSDSRAPLVHKFLALVAFDRHPSVTEVGISLRQDDIGALNKASGSFLGFKTRNLNSSDLDTRRKVLLLLIDQSNISDPLQESTVSLIAEFFDEDVFSALLHKMWDKVPITRRVLEAVVRNKQTNWSKFVRIVLSLNAAGLPLSNDIASLLARSSAYYELRWPIHQHTVTQNVTSGDRLGDIFLSDRYIVLRLKSSLSVN